MYDRNFPESSGYARQPPEISDSPACTLCPFKGPYLQWERPPAQCCAVLVKSPWSGCWGWGRLSGLTGSRAAGSWAKGDVLDGPGTHRIPTWHAAAGVTGAGGWARVGGDAESPAEPQETTVTCPEPKAPSRSSRQAPCEWHRRGQSRGRPPAAWRSRSRTPPASPWTTPPGWSL